MIPEAVFAMLACARLGAMHSVVFGGFAAPELAARIDDAKPVLVLSASCGLEPGRVIDYKALLDRATAVEVLYLNHQLAQIGHRHGLTGLCQFIEPQFSHHF